MGEWTGLEAGDWGLLGGRTPDGDFNPEISHVVHSTFDTTITYPMCGCGMQGVHSLWAHYMKRWVGHSRLRDLFYRTTWGESDQ